MVPSSQVYNKNLEGKSQRKWNNQPTWMKKASQMGRKLLIRSVELKTLVSVAGFQYVADRSR